MSVSVDGYVIEPKEFTASLTSENVILLTATPIVEPFFALAEPEHMMLVLFNETVTEQTFSNPGSFMGIVSGAKEVFPKDLLFVDDITNVKT